MTIRLLRLVPFALLILATGIMQAATFTVTTTADNGDNTTPTAGSLRAAIKNANTTAGASAGSPHIIDATGVSGTISLQSALLVLNNHMTINGPGASTLTVTRGVGSSFSIFATGTGFTITISGISITNGSAAGGGGGILNAGSVLTVNYCTISGNAAPAGGGGGVINAASATLNLNNSTVSGNTCGTNNGAGLHNVGTMTVNNSTISGNTAGTNGGGGLYSIGGTMTLTNCTVSGNTAGTSGGGGINKVLGTVNVRNTIIAGNNGPSTAPDAKSLTAPFTSQGNNLIGNGTGSTGFTNGVNGDQVGTGVSPINPMLNSLAFNGGTTQTMALQSGSPAIDNGHDAVLSAPYNFTTDQRGTGFARKTGSSVDIGAFEFGSTDVPLPVELTGFSLSSSNTSVTLQWRTASEVNNAGFEVQRATQSDSSFTPIASWRDHPGLIGLGTSSEGKSYSFADNDLAPGLYRYRLVDISTDGIRSEHEAHTVRVEDAAMADVRFLRLNPVAPNPVAGELQVSYSLPEAMTVGLEIYSVDGRLITTPLNGAERTAGIHNEVIAAGKLQPGTYTLRLVAGLNSRTQQFVVVR